MRYFLFFFLVLVFLISLSFVSAQVVRDDSFVPVSSESAGSLEGCFVASMSSMLLSLDDPRIGNDLDVILNKLNKDLCRTGFTYPYPSSDVINAVVNFLISIM